MIGDGTTSSFMRSSVRRDCTVGVGVAPPLAVVDVSVSNEVAEVVLVSDVVFDFVFVFVLGSMSVMLVRESMSVQPSVSAAESAVVVILSFELVDGLLPCFLVGISILVRVASSLVLGFFPVPVAFALSAPLVVVTSRSSDIDTFELSPPPPPPPSEQCLVTVTVTVPVTAPVSVSVPARNLVCILVSVFQHVVVSVLVTVVSLAGQQHSLFLSQNRPRSQPRPPPGPLPFPWCP